MTFLAGFERRMDAWTSALWSKMIPPPRHPLEVVGILHRACDDHALILDRQRTVVPNAFAIELPPESHQQLTADGANVGGYLALQVRRYAAEQGYTFTGPVAVQLTASRDTRVGRVRVHSRIAPHRP
ncbi:DUF3662 domain-containing protein [Streptomyces kanamyceticus]|nr:DUF3662 domain-containing protein [Streptomyces kanamyceticus]